MKKILPFIFVILIACNKNKISTIDVDKIELSAATQEVILKKSIPEMKQAYTMLSAIEKKDLWRLKYLSILHNDAGKLTFSQISIIKELLSFLEHNKMDSLSKNPNIGEAFLAKELPRLEKNFTTQQIFLLTELPFYTNNFTISNADNYLQKFINNQKNAIKQHIEIIKKTGSSSYLLPPDDGGDLAPKCTCYYSVYCQAATNGNVCQTGKDDCTKIQECGLWGNSNCTGRCS